MKRHNLDPILGACLVLIVSLVVTLYAAIREKEFVEANQIASPQVSAGLPIAYFLGVAAVFGLVLFFIPVSKLRLVLKAMFAFLFAWGAFVVLALTLPAYVALAAAAAAGLLWLLRPWVWLHNGLMILALASAGSVFGFVLSPWAAVISMLVLSVYDILAVRFGYMVWMARKMSQTDALPVFLIPKTLSTWKLNLRGAGFAKIFEDEASEREFSLLGGGDIGFPLLLVVSVFFAYGFASSVIVGFFSLLGLICAYLIQLFFLKGKPMPALPPISALSLIGFLIVYFTR